MGRHGPRVLHPCHRHCDRVGGRPSAPPLTVPSLTVFPLTDSSPGAPHPGLSEPKASRMALPDVGRCGRARPPAAPPLSSPQPALSEVAQATESNGRTEWDPRSLLPAARSPLPAPRNLYPATCNLSPHPMTFVPPTSPFSLASLPPIPQTESGRDSPNRESFSFAPPGASCCGRFVLSHPGQLPIPRTARAEDSHHRVDSRKRCIFGVRRVRDLCKYFICSLNACCQIGNAR